MLTPLHLWKQVFAIREGGYVERAHCMPHIGSYNVAQHSWNATALLLKLHPDPSTRLIKHVMFHDVAERWVGDIPYPAKKEFPSLGNCERNVTEDVNELLDICDSLNVTDEFWLHGVDMLEFVMWCNDQLMLGNTNVLDAKLNACDALIDMKGALPDPVWRMFETTNKNMGFRTSDWISKLLEGAEDGEPK